MKIIAHFTTQTSAERARDLLQQVGVEPSRLHIWNNLGERGGSSHNAVETGAVVGGAFFGISGLLGGAALGDSFDSHSQRSTDARGVRLVAEITVSDAARIENLLRENGATQIQISDEN